MLCSVLHRSFKSRKSLRFPERSSRSPTSTNQHLSMTIFSRECHARLAFERLSWPHLESDYYHMLIHYLKWHPTWKLDFREGFGQACSGSGFRALSASHFVIQLPITPSFAYGHVFLVDKKWPSLSVFAWYSAMIFRINRHLDFMHLSWLEVKMTVILASFIYCSAEHFWRKFFLLRPWILV